MRLLSVFSGAYILFKLFNHDRRYIERSKYYTCETVWDVQTYSWNIYLLRLCNQFYWSYGVHQFQYF